MSTNDDRLVWVDLEMTGLDPSTCVIVEIATLVTDGQLHVVAEGPNLVIHQPESVLAGMAPEVQAMHAKSGLTDRIRASTTTREEAARATLEFLQAHVTSKSAPLCGNSVWKDKQFLEREMPEIVAHLHYRLVDVSTVKELARRWYGGVALPKKQERHRALDDIRESIAELALYRERLFVRAVEPA
jgi:oligoribonuclease